MLRLELQGKKVRPKILLLQGEVLNMYFLKELHLNNSKDFVDFVKLMISFNICIDYKLPETVSHST